MFELILIECGHELIKKAQQINANQTSDMLNQIQHAYINEKDISIGNILMSFNRFFDHGLTYKKSNNSLRFETTKELFRHWVLEQRIPTGKMGKYRLNAVIKRVKSKTENDPYSLHGCFNEYLTIIIAQGKFPSTPNIPRT